MTESERESKNRRMAFITTAGINLLLGLVLFLVVAFRLPYPPGEGLGVELNFGLDMQGTGENQPEPPVISAAQEEPNQEQPKETEIEKKQQEETVKEENTKPVDQEEVVTSTDGSPVAVKDNSKTVTPQKEAKIAKEEKKEQKVEVVNPNALYKGPTNKGSGASHGDDKNKAGDKGNPDGALDKDALYGKAGGGGGGGDGTSLSMDGWKWDSRPSVTIPNSEMGGVLKFQVKVDGDGEIIDIKVLESSVSPETAQICKQAISKLTFTKTGANVPQISTGTITFVVRSR